MTVPEPAATEVEPANPTAQAIEAIGRMLPRLARLVDNPERFAQTVATQLRSNPTLAQCSIDSLLGCAFLSAQLRLEPGPLGMVWWIPFKNEATFVLGYKGIKALAERHPNVSSVTAATVHENDQFAFENGTSSYLRHRPAVDDRGEPIAWYAIARLHRGADLFRVLNRADVQARRATSKSPDSPAWTQHYDAMARKTAIRAIWADLPIDPATSDAVAYDGAAPPLPTSVHDRVVIDVPAEDDEAGR